MGFAALSLVMTACGDGSDDDAQDSGQAPAQAGATAGAPEAEFVQLKGVSTNVDLDPATAAVLQQNKVTVTPVEPATASMNGSTTTVSFPITEGYASVYPKSQLPFIRGTFSHSGGLTFKAGGKSLTATDFIVNPGSSTLTATVGGKGVQLLDLDGTNVMVSKDADGQTRLEGTVAKLSSAAADALNQTFGVSVFKQGIPLGTVRIIATGTAGPGGAPQAELKQLKGVSTNVDLDPATAAVLQQNKVTVTPVEPATASMNGSTTTVSFPITEGYVSVYPPSQLPFIRGTFSHSGGLTFKAGGKSLTATDFIVNPGSSTLTATVGGKGVQLLDLDGTNVKMSSDGQGVTKLEGTVAKLSSAAADALNQTFGVSVFKQGIPLGVVRIAASETVPSVQTASSGAAASSAAPSSSAPSSASPAPSATPAGGVATGAGGTSSGGSVPALPLVLASAALVLAAVGAAGARLHSRSTSS
ncbi:MAG: hypothetical protein M3N28_10000 [Actinomycetota bacterium]|nr:hypothetical protein [Actinomycetota bacterium]